MTVYIAICAGYDGFFIVGVYSDEATAKTKAAEHEDSQYSAEVHEHTIDAYRRRSWHKNAAGWHILADPPPPPL